MPLISITSGPLPSQTKERLVRELTTLSSQITGIPAEFFFISVCELPDENIAIGGRTVAELKRR